MSDYSSDGFSSDGFFQSDDIRLWSAFHSFVMPDVPGCPIPSIDDALAASAEEFIGKAKVWRMTVSGITTQRGWRDYNLPSLVSNWPTGVLLERVWSVSVGNRDMLPTHEQLVSARWEVNPDQLSQALAYIDYYTANGAVDPNTSNYPLLISVSTSTGNSILSTAEWILSNFCGHPRHYAIDRDETLRFYPIPLWPEEIKAVVSLKLSRFNSIGVPQFIFDSYHEHIVSGAIYRLTRVPGKAWSSPALAELHKSLFDGGVDAGLTRDFHNTPVRSRLRYKMF